ncbi:TlpA family protein disulfide reductase [Tenacibaculum amylolyticum]|uniref:TlpA family protein disulfide reductase n=1 Tax=Tenacibaculum amylolyticum TaxID=104269 RepID=UPI003892E55B
MIRYIVPFLSILLVGCSPSKKDELTYFGGKIINPKSDNVTLYDHNDEVIDTIKLNPDNTFTGAFKDFKPGLYMFRHGTEYQHIFLEPKDSLLIRLNTWDFDESLVFSGTNAHRNNLLVETFLANEEQEKNFYKYFKLAPNEFMHKIDSLKNIKDKYLEKYLADNENVSEQYVDILKIALYFPLYKKIEAFIIDNSLKETPENLSDAFTAHRKDINIGKDSLMFFPPYRLYVFNNLYSNIYEQNIKDDSDDFTIALLNSIDKRINSEELKNKLLKQTTIRHFYKKTSCNMNKKAYQTFLSLSTNENDKKDISLLLNDVKGIVKNRKLPNFKVLTPQGSLENITDIIKNEKAVIYFRNREYSSDAWVASRVNFLINNNPNVEFLVINIGDDQKQYIKDLNIKYQFFLKNNSKAHQFLTSKYPRTVLVNKKGIVINNFCSIAGKKFQKQLSEL